jgi:hypothetical protein
MRFATCQDHAGGDDIAGSLAVNPSCAQPKIQSHDKLNFAGLSQKPIDNLICKECVALWPFTQ